jgi:hypothetical protein
LLRAGQDGNALPHERSGITKCGCKLEPLRLEHIADDSTRSRVGWIDSVDRFSGSTQARQIDSQYNSRRRQSSGTCFLA